MLCPANLSHDLVDESDDRLIDLMTLVDRLDHPVLRHFVRTCLDHDDFLARRSHCQLQITVFPLLLVRIDHELAVDQSHLRRRTRSVKRNIRYRCDDR